MQLKEYVVPYINHILHRDRFWATSIASGSVRLWDLGSCCMVLSHVMWGRPHGLLFLHIIFHETNKRVC